MNVSHPPCIYASHLRIADGNPTRVTERTKTCAVREPRRNRRLLTARGRLLMLLGFAALPAAPAFAQESLRPAGHRPLRAAYSDSRELQLRIDPGRGQEPCRAVLLQRGKRDPLWEAELVNETSPEYAFIRDDGAWVVTLNEYRKGGAENAVVVYNAKGEPAAAFELEELLEPGDRVHVKREGEALRWLDGAKTAWQRNPDAFEIRLPWGAAVLIELEAGKAGKRASTPFEAAIDVEWDEPNPGEAHGPDSFIDKMAEMLLMLDASTTEALSDPNLHARESPQMKSVILAIKDIGKNPENLPFGVNYHFDEHSGIEVSVTWYGEFDSPEQKVEKEQLLADQIRDLTMRYLAEQIFPDAYIAGNSSALGVPVPLPDPENPVNYVDWFNEFRMRQPGVNAAQDMQLAIETRVPFSNDAELDELFGAATSGDPDALRDPRLVDWLAANQDALDAFSAAGKADHYSTFYQSDDGSMIGMLLPDLAGVRDLARIAAVDARHALAQGDAETAMNRAMDIFNNARLVGESGTLISTLVGVAMGSLSQDLVADIIASDSSGTVDYAALAQRLDQVEGASSEWFARSVQFERAMALDTLQRLYQVDPDTGEAALDYQYLGMLTSGEGDTNPVLTAMGIYQAGFDGSLSKMNEYYDRLGSGLAGDYLTAHRNMEAIEQAVEPGGELNHPLLSMLAPSLTRATQISTRGQSGQRATRLLAHLHAYRQANGSFPESLEVFGEHDFARDPFSGGYFRYVPEGESFRLYSVGVDGVDGGGIAEKQWDRGDLHYWPRR